MMPSRSPRCAVGAKVKSMPFGVPQVQRSSLCHLACCIRCLADRGASWTRPPGSNACRHHCLRRNHRRRCPQRNQRHHCPQRNQRHHCPQRNQRHHCLQRSQRHHCLRRNQRHHCPRRSQRHVPFAAHLELLLEVLYHQLAFLLQLLFGSRFLQASRHPQAEGNGSRLRGTASVATGCLPGKATHTIWMTPPLCSGTAWAWGSRHTRTAMEGARAALHFVPSIHVRH